MCFYVIKWRFNAVQVLLRCVLHPLLACFCTIAIACRPMLICEQRLTQLIDFVPKYFLVLWPVPRP